MTIYTKICAGCKISKPFTEFNKHKSSKDGHQVYCKTCRKEQRQTNKEYYKNYRQTHDEYFKEYSKNYRQTHDEYFKEYSKNYRQNNKEQIKEYGKEYSQNNKEQIQINRKIWRENNKEQNKEYSKNYRQNNKEQINERKNKRRRIRRSTDPLYNLIIRTRGLVTKSLRANNYSKKSRTYEILGCSYEEFKTHLESQFTEGMNWDNRDKWHIDHKIPVSWGKTEEEIIALNHYTNLQPLWAEDNLHKRNRWSD